MSIINPGPATSVTANQSPGVVATWADSTGTVLNTPSGSLISISAVANGGVGSLISYTSAAGTVNNVTPGNGFPGGIDRLEVNTTAGAAVFTGLLAGTDDQIVVISPSPNQLTLNVSDAGSVSANQFRGSANVVIAANASVMLCYYAGTVNKWVVVR